MIHIDKIKELIKEQGWTIKESYKIGPFYRAKIEKDSVEKEINLSISKDEEFEYFQNEGNQ